MIHPTPFRAYTPPCAPAFPAAPASRLRAALIGAALLGSVLALPAQAAKPAHPAQPALSAHQAWIRWLPAGLPAAGYLRLDNHTAAPVDLVKVDSPAHYSSVSLHRTVTRAGISRMEEVERVAVPAHSSLRLAPGGYHIMLLNPKQTIKPGMHVPVTLRFSDGKELTVAFVVRKSKVSAPAAEPPAQPASNPA